MGPILLHNHCLQEGIRAVMESALQPRYGGCTALYATVAQTTVHSLFIQEFPGKHRGAPLESHTLELFSMRWRDPLEYADYKTLLERAFLQKTGLTERFTDWLLKEGWEESAIQQIPLSHRRREFARAFPNRWEQLQQTWREELLEQEWQQFDWNALAQELNEQFILLSDQAPVCTVVKNVSL